jgi:hypothetical protein
MHTPRIADVAEFSFHARNFCEGVPEVRQAKVTQQGMIDASERVCIHALVRPYLWGSLFALFQKIVHFYKRIVGFLGLPFYINPNILHHKPNSVDWPAKVYGVQ